LYGKAAEPDNPKYLESTTTPSVEEAPPGN
jgi:hypothetical protein